MDEIVQIMEEFQITGSPVRAERFGGGHINETFKITTQEKSAPDYLLQKINHEVFQDVQGLMQNISRVTEHIKSKKTSGPRQVLTIIPSKEGRLFYHADGVFWRVFIFIDNARTYENAKSEKQAFEAAKMVGLFLRDLSDYPAADLHITIPNFHNIEFRLQHFHNALSGADRQRKIKALHQIEAVQNSAPILLKFFKSATSGELPLRITHNDTKFNNVLLDEDGHGVALVDLDTVMPGYVFYDVGDGLRTGTVTAEEDEQNLDRVKVDESKYDAYINGYLEGAGDILWDNELESLTMAGFYMAFMMGVRFLTDFLDGDVYYRTDFPEHNYYRARCQLHTAKLLKRKVDYTRSLVRKYGN
jgi:Ser/Thr protein kinase RdoA (MazF antagonist)